MAYRTPAAVQNENFHIRIGKDVDLVKPALPKPAKARRQDRKALKDLSNTGKPPVSGPSKPSALKEKPALRGGRETIKNAPKSAFLTDEEMKRCRGWAREGIELTHFARNDVQKLQKDIEEERINKQVQKMMSDSHEWLHAAYDLGLSKKKELSKDTTDVKKIEIGPEVLLLPCITKSPTSGSEEIDDDLLESEADHLLFLERPVELQLKED